MSRVVGIDLGTSFSLIAYLEGGRPVVIPNTEGSPLTPSVVGFLPEGRRLVGRGAHLQAHANPGATVFSIKRHMGSGYRVKVGDREYRPEEVSALILRKVKADAESYLQERVDKAVISVPAYFNASQRQATLDAGAMAGLEVLRAGLLLALAYGLDQKEARTVLVWDLGGGTFDVSILELAEGLFEVKAVNGNTWLGGDDYDQRLADYLAREFLGAYGLDLQHTLGPWRLKETAERLKAQLSSQEEVRLRMPFPVAGDHPPFWETRVTRARFEELTQDLRQRMIDPTRQALADARLRAEDIDQAILVGGASRMPGVRRLFRELLGQEPVPGTDPDEAVALGAALQAGILTGELPGRLLIQVTPLSLGIETQGELFAKIIPRNTPLPVSRSQIFTNAADGQTSMGIHVLQGEREMATYNVTLDRFELTDLPPLPRGQARVEVSFDMDVNGTLHVSATDLHSDQGRNIRVNPHFHTLSQLEIARIREEGEGYAEQDRAERQAVEMAIKAGNLARIAEQALAEAPGDMDDSLIEAMEGQVLALKAAVARGLSQEVEASLRELEKLVRRLQQETKPGVGKLGSTPYPRAEVDGHPLALAGSPVGLGVKSPGDEDFLVAL